MAQKTTYLYKVLIEKNGLYQKTEYCYARNARQAIDELKVLYKSEKYDNYKAIMFGNADIKHHPGFERMSWDEVKYIMDNNIATGEAYSNRKNRIPEGAKFVTPDQLEAELR